MQPQKEDAITDEKMPSLDDAPAHHLSNRLQNYWQKIYHGQKRVSHSENMSQMHAEHANAP